MNILVVHPYLSILGGGERVCLHAIKALIEEGHNVTLVSESIKPGELESFLGFNVLDDVAHVSYKKFDPKVKKFSVYQRVFHHTLSKPTARKKIGDMDIEFLTQDVGFTLCIGRKKIAYVHFPEFLVHLETTKPKSRWFWRLYYAPIKWFWKKQIEKIDLFLCNSEFTKCKISERWNKEAEVIYPPVDVEKFKPASKENIVVTLGRFEPSKNYDVVNEVANVMPEVEFKIIGIKQDIMYYRKIRDSKPDNVALLTDLTRDEVISELAKAKVYFHTMVNEHFGISIVEAMASGCIPVVHNSGGAREAVGNLGLRYNTVEDCADLIKTAMQTNVNTNMLVERAKEFSSERFREKIKNLLVR